MPNTERRIHRRVGHEPRFQEFRCRGAHCLIRRSRRAKERGHGHARSQVSEPGGAQHAIGLDDLFQALLGAPVAAIRVGMEPLHKFLIPRLDLDQGGVMGQLQRVHRHDLQPRQLPLRTAHRGGSPSSANIAWPSWNYQRGLARPRPGGALAQRPGGAVAE